MRMEHPFLWRFYEDEGIIEAPISWTVDRQEVWIDWKLEENRPNDLYRLLPCLVICNSRVLM